MKILINKIILINIICLSFIINNCFATLFDSLSSEHVYVSYGNVYQIEGRSTSFDCVAYLDTNINGKWVKNPIDVLMISGVIVVDSKLNYAYKFITHNDPNCKVEKNEWYYSLGNIKVVVDRGLRVNNEQTYFKNSIIQWVKRSYVGFLLTEGMYITFDGRIHLNEIDILQLGLEKVKDNQMIFLKSQKNTSMKGNVLQITDPSVVQNEVLSVFALACVPNAIAISSSEWTVNKEKFNPLNLANENVIAVLIKIPEKQEAEVYTINGDQLGTIDISIISDSRKSKNENIWANEDKILDQLIKITFNSEKIENITDSYYYGLFNIHKNNNKKSFTYELYFPRISEFGYEAKEVKFFMKSINYVNKIVNDEVKE